MPNFVEIGPNAAEISRFPIFEDGGRGHLGFSKFQIFNGGDGQEGRTTSPCQISSKSLETRLRYVSFNIMLVWLENAYSCPFLRGFGGTKMMSLIVLTPKRSVLGWNHVIWAINRENRSRGSSWAYEREKGQDRTGKKSQKGYISPICGEAPTEAMYMKICILYST